MTVVELKNGLLDEKINIALVQLESPFDDELCEVPEQNTSLFRWLKKNIDKRKKKITAILDNIVKEFSSQAQIFPDLIVFPEYSIPFEMLPELKEYSKYFKIIVAGSDQVRDPTNEMFKKNVCPIIIRDMDPVFIEKNSLYEDEMAAVKKGNLERSNLEIHWTPSTEPFCLQIFICLDFLDNHNLLDKRKKGGIVVLMCSESMKEYACQHYIDIRFGKFISFCNAVSLNNKKPIMVGNSAIYGAIKERDKNDAIISIDGALEGVIFASVTSTFNSRIKSS